MKKQLLSIALIIGTSSNTMFGVMDKPKIKSDFERLAERELVENPSMFGGVYKYKIKNESDGVALFKIFDGNNQFIVLNYAVPPRSSRSTEGSSMKAAHVLQYANTKDGIEALKQRPEYSEKRRAQQTSSFRRENGVGSGTFTFSEKDGITFKPNLTTRVSDTAQGVKSKFSSKKN